MKKWVCSVCGYVHTGSEPPAQCPQCKAPASKFQEQGAAGAAQDAAAFAAVHSLGIAGDVEDDIKNDLRTHFTGECTEVGMYLAMSRAAEREGYPEIAEAYRRYAFEEAEHAARFGEMLGEVLSDSTRKNLEMRVEAEFGACAGKTDIAKRAKERGYDAIHDSVHEMARDEARHCAGFRGLLKRYFG
ncbi:MAG: NADH peroxidase [Treponema sp.]|jgi:rubrerythrin|nr:NADH peroxidase [Treponema sp.]